MLVEAVAAFAVCATGEHSNAALDKWEAAGVPIVRECNRESLYIYDGKPPLTWPIHDWYIGATMGREAYCWGEGWLATFVCAHELGHLFGLDHPRDNIFECQGQYEAHDAAYNAYSGAGHPKVVNPTVMDNGGCPGASEGPYAEDVEAVLRKVEK